MNVLIPMAGLGQRFQAAGYDKPKPLIDVFGKPMIERVTDSLKASDINYIFVAQQQHAEMGLEDFLTPVGKVVWLNELTEGAACTTLLAKEYINNDEELVIANCDQYMEWNFQDFLSHSKQFDGCLATFNSTNPHHSYAKTKGSLVTEVAEKIVISDKASAGIYYFKNGSQYVKGAEQMIEKNIRTNNEFYICPVYNELLETGLNISTYNVDVTSKHMLGTPEELSIFVDKVNNQEVTLG